MYTKTYIYAGIDKKIFDNDVNFRPLFKIGDTTLERKVSIHTNFLWDYSLGIDIFYFFIFYLKQMSTLTVPQSVIRTRSSSFIKALADVTGQGKHSETFTTPDLKVSSLIFKSCTSNMFLKDNIIIPDLVDFHVKFSAQHTTFVTDSGKSLSLKDRGIGVYKCTKYILDNFVNIKQGSVVAFLAGEFILILRIQQ